MYFFFAKHGTTQTLTYTDIHTCIAKLWSCSSTCTAKTWKKLIKIESSQGVLMESYSRRWVELDKSITRNKWNHGEGYQTIDSFQYNVRRQVDEWELYLKKKNQRDCILGRRSWVPLDEECVKINTYASFVEQSKKGGCGVQSVETEILKFSLPQLVSFRV